MKRSINSTADDVSMIEEILKVVTFFFLTSSMIAVGMAIIH